jgi:uncharacterized protein YqgC (DUF456 family)
MFLPSIFSGPALVIAFIILMVPGLFMVFVPFLPAMSYLFVLAIVFGLATGFIKLTLVELAILGALWCLSIIIDFLSGLLGAKYGGASRKSFLYGLGGMLLGAFFLPFGPLIGLTAGVLIGELSSRRDVSRAASAAGATLLGTVFGMVINGLIALVFVVLFAFFAFQ